jgi:hypothetical protein
VVCGICFDVRSVDPALARRAAAWAQAFHPPVGVRLEDGCAHIWSAEHSDDALRSIWLSSLANERLHASAAIWRATTLAALVQ